MRQNYLKLVQSSLTEIFNNIDDNLSILDSECNVLWANKAYCDRLGKDFSEISGKKCYSLWHHLSSPCVNCPCIKALKTNRTELVERITAEGRHFILIGIPIVNNMRRKLVFEIGKETTSNKLIDERAIELAKANAINHIIGEFSHQFKNIFTGIYGFTQILMKEIRDKKQVDVLEKLIKSLEKGKSFLKALERINSSTFTDVVFDLNYLLISIKNALNELIHDKKIKLNLHLSKSPSVIRGDPSQIREIIIELIKNAKDSIENEGLIDLIVEKKKSKVILTVKDNGVGMDRLSKQKCFEPFFTTDPRRFGLGLTIVKNTVERLSGSIRIKSFPGTGTTVKIYFPEAILPQEQGT